MIENLLRNWWVLGLRGLAALLFAILAFGWPGITLTVLVWIFAAYMLADGVFAILAGISAAHRHGRWWPLAVEGVLDLLAGAIAFLWPGIALLTFIYIAAIWAILTGAALLAAARRLSAHGEGMLLFAGLLSLAWGVVVIFWPIAGELALAWWIGAYALIFGVLMLALAWRLRRRWHELGPG